MSLRWTRHPEGFVGRAVISRAVIWKGIVTLLVASIVNVSVPALAAASPANETPPTIATTTPLPAPSLLFGAPASQHVQAAIARAIALDARATELETQSGPAGDSSGHWCVGGLVLLAAGVTAAIVSGVRRDENPQKPSPPVGVVLGTAAAAVGGVMMVRTCKH